MSDDDWLDEPISHLSPVAKGQSAPPVVPLLSSPTPSRSDEAFFKRLAGGEASVSAAPKGGQSLSRLHTVQPTPRAAAATDERFFSELASSMSTDAQAGAEPVVQRVLSFAGVDGASDADNFFDNLGDASPGSKASTAVPRPDAVAEPLRAVTPAAQPVVEDSAAGAAHASRDAVQRLATQPEDAVPAEGNGGDALPDGWVVGTAPSGHTYFFHHPTGTSQWEHPGGGAAAALDAAAAPSTGDAAGAGGVPYAAVPQPEPQLQPQPQPQQLLQQQPQQHQQQHQQQHWVGAQREHPFQSAAAAVVPPWSGAHANGAGSQHPAPSPTATLVPAGRSPHGRPRCCAAAFTPGGVVVVASRDGAALHAHPLRSLLPPPPPAWAPPLSRLRGGGLEEGARVADARDGCLWAILGAAARAKGHLSDPHAASSISAALLRAHDDSGAAGSQPLQPTLPPPQPPAPDACARVEQLLLSGRREEAVAAASDAGMHGCALLLCRSLPAAAAERATAAAASAVAPPGSALHTSLVLCAGHPALVGGGAGDEAGCSRLLASWRPNLAAMLAARAPGDGPAMVGLGDALVGVGCIEGAHACYLLAGVPLSPYDPSARLVLPGADHRACPRTYADDWDAHLMAELSEACSRALYPGVHPPGAAAAAAHRLAFAASLAEAGRPAEGAAAAEGAAKCVRAAGAAAAHEVNVQLVLAVAASLEERLRGAGRGAHGGGGGGGAAGKLLGLSLGGLSSLLDKGLASVFGDDAGAGGAGGAPQPFSRSASAASELSSEGGAQPHQPPPQPRASRGDPGDPGAHEPKGGMIRSISSLLLGGGKRASRPETANKFHYDDKLQLWVEDGKPPPAVPEPLAPPPSSSSARPEQSDAGFRPVGPRAHYVETPGTRVLPAGAQPGGSSLLPPRPQAPAARAFFVPAAPPAQEWDTVAL